MKNRKYNSESADYPTFNEYKAKQIINIATAVGIGVSAATISVVADGKDKKVPEPASSEVTPASPATGGQAGAGKKKAVKPVKRTVREQIVLLAANLGHREFKEREKATVTLIKLGKECVKKKDTKTSDLIKDEMEKSKKSKDPEIKERAKKILLALTPPPPKIPDVQVDGDIEIAGDIAF